MDPRTGWNVVNQTDEYVDVRIPRSEWHLFQHLIRAPESQLPSAFHPDIPVQLTWTSLADQFYQSFVRPRILRPQSRPPVNSSSNVGSSSQDPSSSQNSSGNGSSSSENSSQDGTSSESRSEIPVILHSELECCVCLETFQEQPVMGCSHYVCQECLSNLRKDECPVCRRALNGGIITDQIRQGIHTRRQQDERDRRRDTIQLDQRIAQEQMNQQMQELLMDMMQPRQRFNPIGDLLHRLFF